MVAIGKETFSRKGITTPSFVLGGCFGAILTILMYSLSESTSTFDRCAATIDSKSISTNNKAVSANDDNGWHQIDVFYGDREGMLTSLKDEWFSQVGQDKLVYKYLGNLKNGFFIDLASNDATLISNSYALETFHGWRGICVEPNAKYWARLAFRKCNVVAAVVSNNRMEAINFNFGKKGSETVKYTHTSNLENAMGGGIVASGMDNARMTNTNKQLLVKRYTVTLGEIFSRNNAPKMIDYLSLDVEGAEYFVLSVFPWESYQIRIMTIERPTEELKTFLDAKGYKYIETLGDFGETVWAHSSEVDRINKMRGAAPSPAVRR